jgi:hypothetical protein
VCTTVIVKDVNDDIWNILGLKDAGFYVDPKDYPPKWSFEHDCLCGVNVLRVLSRAGVVFEYNADDDSYFVEQNAKTNSHQSTQDQKQSQERIQ